MFLSLGLFFSTVFLNSFFAVVVNVFLIAFKPDYWGTDVSVGVLIVEWRNLVTVEQLHWS